MWHLHVVLCMFCVHVVSFMSMLYGVCIFVSFGYIRLNLEWRLTYALY